MMRLVRSNRLAFTRTVFVAAAMTIANAAAAATPLETAKDLAAHAGVEYKVGHFDQALALYGRAYESYPTPALLFDIGQCHKMLKNYERAIYFFHGYLRDAPDAPNRAFVAKLMAESQTELDAQHAAEATEAQRRAAEASKAAAAAHPTATPSGSRVEGIPDRPGNPTLRIAGIATAGAGLVLLATGTYFGLHSRSLASEISQISTEHGMWSDAAQSEYNSGKSAATTADVFYIVGAVALATGGVLSYLGLPKKGTESAPAAAIAPTAGGAAFIVAGRF
jgi:tetratricopeptide (TPR) repeat protein